jgi:regulator-associated protein of mTOR
MSDSDADRLANERGMACYLQESVYDASPLVRAEVALGLGRFANGHEVLFQVPPPSSTPGMCTV